MAQQATSLKSRARAASTSRSGDYTIDDMVRHIGIFTTYLADHAAEYGGNSGSVFIYLPFGTHGSDLRFPSYHNQSFLYYMERFMYQYR